MLISSFENYSEINFHIILGLLAAINWYHILISENQWQKVIFMYTFSYSTECRGIYKIGYVFCRFLLLGILCKGFSRKFSFKMTRIISPTVRDSVRGTRGEQSTRQVETRIIVLRRSSCTVFVCSMPHCVFWRKSKYFFIRTFL